MSSKTPYFTVDSQTTAESLVGELPSLFQLIEIPGSKHIQTLLDTFDWRLFSAGWQLRMQGAPGSLILSSLDGRKQFCICSNETLPRFVTDIEDPQIRNLLQPVIEMRALLPRARISSNTRKFNILNKKEKAVACLHIIDTIVRPPSGRQRTSLATAVQLLPAHGNNKKLASVKKAMKDRFKLTVADPGQYLATLEVAGATPGDYNNRIDVTLTADMNAHTATRKILSSQLEVIKNNLDGTRKNIDSEFLHDFRVSIRRTRSALSQIKGVFADNRVEYFKSQFGWLGEVTGSTRDLDVLLNSYNDYRDSLPPPLCDDLDPFQEFLVNHQRSEQQTMRRRLSTRKFKELLSDWEAFIDEQALPDTENAARPVTQLAQERIWKMYRRVLRQGRAITDTTTNEELHELRKSCKKLRYLIEFFSSLYPSNTIHPVTKRLKKLLDNLGEYNDTTVQVESIENYARHMAEDGIYSSRAFIAMGALIGNLFRRQATIRKDFNKQFKAFDTNANRRNYRKLFKQAGQ